MGWLITLWVLLLIAFIPLGVFVRYDSQGFLVRIVAGFLHFTVFPIKNKKKQKKAPSEKQKQEQKKETSVSQEKKENPPKRGGSIRDFLPLVHILLDFMNQFRKKMTINQLRLKLILAGEDPCDLAVNYGRAWAALGNLMPALENAFTIKKRDCEVECDFTATETLVKAQAEMTLRFWEICQLGIVYGFLLIKELLILKKKRKGGAVE